MGMHQTGVSLKADVCAGVAVTQNISFAGSDGMQNGSKYYSNDYTRHETYTTYGHGAFSAAPSVSALWRW